MLNHACASRRHSKKERKTMSKPLTQIEEAMIGRAIARHGVIEPCGSFNTFNECFMDYPNGKTFWYNTEDHSTHVVREFV